MRHTFLLLTMGIVIGVAIASKKEPEAQVDPAELAIEKSMQTMKMAAAVSQRADQVVVSRVAEMKQTIEVLEQEKEELVEQVTEMKHEINTIKSAPVQPFDVLAIGVPDTASRGK
jgi:TolA-binding protein